MRPVVVRFVPGLMSFVSHDVPRFAPDFVSAAAHRGDAGRAELRMLGFHAGGDLRHVRNELRAEPHGVGRAGLLDVRLTCGIGAAEYDRATRRPTAPADKIKRTIGMGISPVFERFASFICARQSSGARTVEDSMSGLHVAPSAGRPSARPKVAKVRSPTSGIRGTRRCGKRVSGVPGHRPQLAGFDQSALQRKPRPKSRNWPLVMLSGHGSMSPSMMSALALSKDMWRQNLPSGIGKRTSPTVSGWRAAVDQLAAAGRWRHGRRTEERR